MLHAFRGFSALLCRAFCPGSFKRGKNDALAPRASGRLNCPHALGKAFHIVFVASWFAGLFYLPRIFVNLAMVAPDSGAERERLLLMARKLLQFTTILAVPAWRWGCGCGWVRHWPAKAPGNGWMHAKLTIVLLVVVTTTPAACCCASWPAAKASAAMCGFAGSMKRLWCCC